MRYPNWVDTCLDRDFSSLSPLRIELTLEQSNDLLDHGIEQLLEIITADTISPKSVTGTPNNLPIYLDYAVVLIVVFRFGHVLQCDLHFVISLRILTLAEIALVSFEVFHESACWTTLVPLQIGVGSTEFLLHPFDELTVDVSRSALAACS